MDDLNETPDVKEHSDLRQALELKGIELHLDVLLAYFEAGLAPSMSAEDAAVIKRLSNEVGGFSCAFDSPAHAEKYKRLTVRMATELGAFYHHQEQQPE